MKDSFRRSMTWLHTWAGLLVGWVLYFVFLTGTFGYINAELDLWMRPEQRTVAEREPPARLLFFAERRLRDRAPDAELWQIAFPDIRGNFDFSVRWRAWPAHGEERRALASETLNPHDGLPAESKVRETGGGMTLYVMHYALHYMPKRWAYYVVGICTMFMLVAILSGVVAHKRIFKDFFTFRPGKGQRSWLDGHNLLAVTALPFHLMMTWSGLIFFIFTYMPIPVDSLYPRGEAHDRFREESSGFERPRRHPAHPLATLVPLESLLPVVEEKWGPGKIEYVSVYGPGRANAVVVFQARHDGIRRERPALRFDGIAGAMLDDGPAARTAAGRFESALLALHEGHFAGAPLRGLYIFASLVGTAMIATGLLLWSTKRKTKLQERSDIHVGIVVVDILNLVTIIGLPIGIAAYFWANRLLPLDMEVRAAWEVHTMFIAWAATILFAIRRPLIRAWVALCWLAAAAWGLLPVLNILTTDRHLGTTLPANEWALASIDLGMSVTGLFFAFVAHMLRRWQISGAALPVQSRATRPTTGAAQ